MRYGPGWIHPATPGLAQTPCKAGEECSLPSPHLVVQITQIAGFCAQCAHVRGIKQGVEDDEPSSEQLSLEGPWGA